MGAKGLKFLHDNARPHIKEEVKDYIKAQGLELVPHPPYSPDLAPCDFWLNDYIKRHLGNYTDEEEYRKTFEKLLERMQRCIDNQGDYFEHMMYRVLSN